MHAEYRLAQMRAHELTYGRENHLMCNDPCLFHCFIRFLFAGCELSKAFNIENSFRDRGGMWQLQQFLTLFSILAKYPRFCHLVHRPGNSRADSTGFCLMAKRSDHISHASRKNVAHSFGLDLNPLFLFMVFYFLRIGTHGPEDHITLIHFTEI